MMTTVCSVYDSKAHAWLQPFFSQTPETAQRAFMAAANDPEHGFHKYAADYTLFDIGEWDELAGKLTMHEAAINLGTAIVFIERERRSMQEVLEDVGSTD